MSFTTRGISNYSPCRPTTSPAQTLHRKCGSYLEPLNPSRFAIFKHLFKHPNRSVSDRSEGHLRKMECFLCAWEAACQFMLVYFFVLSNGPLHPNRPRSWAKVIWSTGSLSPGYTACSGLSATESNWNRTCAACGALGRCCWGGSGPSGREAIFGHCNPQSLGGRTPKIYNLVASCIMLPFVTWCGEK